MMRATGIGLFTALFVGTAQAAVAPPSGFDSWIAHVAVYCVDGPPQDICAGSATGSLAIADRTNNAIINEFVHEIAGGSITPNTLRGFASSTGTLNILSLAIRDTYTLSGPAGEVTITPKLTVEGHGMRIQDRPGAVPIGEAVMTASIGTDFFADGTSIIGAFAGGQDKIPAGVGALSGDLFVEAAAARTVTVNVPFMLAFHVELRNVSASEIDALSTATIGFDIPAGYTLTSELGWTPVPLPPPFALLALGCGALFRLRTQV